MSDYNALRQEAASHALGFDAVNSNTFQDQKSQRLFDKFGSLTHADSGTRTQAVEHNLECIEIGRQLGSTALTVWIADGSNFPGQTNLGAAFGRYVDSLKTIYEALPKDWSVFLEHKLYEPAFYSTVISDWGSSFMAALELGPKARCLVDLGHHAPNTNIEQIVARLIRAGKLAQRASMQASLIDREALMAAQESSDALLGYRLVKQAFVTDVSPILAEARRRKGGAIDPIGLYRDSGYRAKKSWERPTVEGNSAGIV